MELRRWPPRARAAIALGLAMATLATPERAQGYEFEVSAQTVGQGYSLRSFRFAGPDLVLSRRRFSQSLSLSIWDIGGRQRDRRPYDRVKRGLDISFTGYLRIDHDFGAWSTGSLILDNEIHEAVDLVPELEANLLTLDILYGVLAIEGIADGLLAVRVGRQLEVGALDWWSMDGVSVAVTPDDLPVAVRGFAGLRVRDASPAGSSVHEPDGTSSGQCAEYVEGPVPGSGAWRPIDVERAIDNRRFRNDYDMCPQRQELMPTFGGAVETRGLGWLWARLSYRRSVSPTTGLIGPADRFDVEDTGLYPNELGQAPGWGVNEEFLVASARGHVRVAGGQLAPYGALRYNALVGTIDEGHVGARMRRGSHSVEPEMYYSLPTFDGDSIFNVFSTQPFTDVRVTYDVSPREGRVAGYARAWLRKYGREDEPDEGEATSDVAGGVQLGGQYQVPRRLVTRLDVFWDGGYGGTRAGGHAAAAWQTTETTGLRTRLSIVHVGETPRAGASVVIGVQAGASYVINRGITLHLMAEDSASRIAPSQLRVLGLIDLSFFPET